MAVESLAKWIKLVPQKADWEKTEPTTETQKDAE